MSKLLILKFKNAQLFRKKLTKQIDKKGSKDKLVIGAGKNSIKFERNDIEEFVEPITKYQVSGMLHALFGERPVSHNKASVTAYNTIDRIDEMANNSFIKITSYENNKGFVEETTMLRKATWNSWLADPKLDWWSFEKAIGTKKFALFLTKLSEVFDLSPDKMSLSDCLNYMREYKTPENMKMFEDVFAKGNLSYIFDEPNPNGKVDGQTFFRSYLPRTVLYAVDKSYFLDGEIIVPVLDDDIEKLNNHTGIARILDGGFVTIVGVKSGNIVNLDGYTKVSEISTQKQ